MTFDYRTLRNAAKEGTHLGNWRGKPVFACSAADIKDKGNGAYFVLYDDENLLVARNNNGNLMSYGSVSTSGTVTEYSFAKGYGAGETKKEKKEEKKREPVKMPTVTMGVDYEVIVANTLQAARDMTVNDLLDGFNYGLDVTQG